MTAGSAADSASRRVRALSEAPYYRHLLVGGGSRQLRAAGFSRTTTMWHWYARDRWMLCIAANIAGALQRQAEAVGKCGNAL